MLVQGLTLMVAGMGTVILFLALMVLVMQGTGVFFRKYAHLFKEESETESRLERLSVDDTDVIAVVVAAVNAYMKR